MTFGELAQRLRRADWLNGLGIYVGTHEVALAHAVKHLFNVAVRRTATFPLPPRERAAERRQALAQAVGAFTGGASIDNTYLCLPRGTAAFNRVLLPAAARENLAQVLEYEIEHLIPLPRDQVYFDYSVRPHGDERIEVLLMCIPREVVSEYLDALEDAAVRPRGIVLASTAIADYVAFCRGGAPAPLGLFLAVDQGVEIALLSGGRLVASQLLPADRISGAADLSRVLAREMAEEMVEPEGLQVYQCQLANGAGPLLPEIGDADLVGLAAGRLPVPPEFSEGRELSLLPAVGAALHAVREGTVAVNLLPAEGRGRHDDGMSLWTVGLLVAAMALTLIWGVSALAKDAILRSQVNTQLEDMAPRVEVVRKLQDEIDDMRKQVDALSPGSQPRATILLRELSDVIPTDAHLTALTLRGERLTLEGQARSASDLIEKLDKSKHFKKPSFNSPTTKGSSDKERFSIQAEVER